MQRFIRLLVTLSICSLDGPFIHAQTKVPPVQVAAPGDTGRRITDAGTARPAPPINDSAGTWPASARRA